MIRPMVPFPVTISDPSRRFQGHGDALDELCAQLTRDLFAIAKFLSVLIFAVFLPDFIFCTTVAYTFGLQTPITAKRSMRGCWATTVVGPFKG